jgi:hypothetical protein
MELDRLLVRSYYLCIISCVNRSVLINGNSQILDWTCGRFNIHVHIRCYSLSPCCSLLERKYPTLLKFESGQNTLHIHPMLGITELSLLFSSTADSCINLGISPLCSVRTVNQANIYHLSPINQWHAAVAAPRQKDLPPARQFSSRPRDSLQAPVLLWKKTLFLLFCSTNFDLGPSLIRRCQFIQTG